MDKVWKPVPDVEELKYHGTPEKPDIKIFVSHRIDLDSETIDNPLYIPVRCGAVYDERENVTMLGDDTGDNISEKRNSFCELTVLYWAWKNIKADYYGLCHYRRYLSFADRTYPGDGLGQGLLDSMAPQILSDCALTDKDYISKTICQYDLLVSKEYCMKNVVPNSTCKNVREQWEVYCSSYLKSEHFDLLLSLIKKHAPEFYEDAISYMNGKYFRGFNCFIMKRSLLENMCDFMFPILFEFDACIDKSNFSDTQKRAAAYAGEWLFSIWVFHQKKKTNFKISERQLLAFQNTEKIKVISPAFSSNNIPVIMTLNDGNRSRMSVTLESIIENCSNEYNYDFILLQRTSDSDQWKEYLRSSENKLIEKMSSKKNISIRFYSPTDSLEKIECHDFGTPSTEENYYLALLPWILPNYNKALYINEFILLQEDLSKLFDLNISSYYIAGVKDALFLALLNGLDNKFKSLVKKTLNLRDPYNYISDSILILNMDAIRNQFSSQIVISTIENNKFNNISGDAINVLYQNHIYFLSQSWAALQWLDINHIKLQEYIPSEISNEIKKIKKANAISLRSISNTPFPPQSFAGQLFWKYASLTPFYLQLFHQTIPNFWPAIFEIQTKIGLYDTRSDVRKFADKFFPKGSKRRQFIKYIIPKNSMRWRFCKQIYYLFRPKYRPPKMRKIT